MPVFTDSQMNILNESIRRTLNEHLDHEECDVTVDDILNVFVKPEHHEACRLATDLFTYRMYGSNAFSFKHANTTSEGQLVFNLTLSYVYDKATNRNRIPWVPPAYAGSADNWRTDTPSHEKLVWYLTRLHQLFRSYNNMALVLAVLNTRCTSAGQMAFVWPAITQLIDRAEKRGEKVETLKKMVSRRNNAGCPIVTPAMREICKDSGAMLSYLQLVGQAKPRRDHLGFEIALGTDVTQIKDREFYAAL